MVSLFGGITRVAGNILRASGDMLLSTPANKTTVWEQPVYKDINFTSASLAQPSADNPDIGTFVDNQGNSTGIESLAFATGESVSGVLELQHDYRQGTNFLFHLHFQIIDAPTGVDKINWRLTYTTAKNDATVTPAQTVDLEVDVDTQYQLYFVSFPEIDGSNTNIEDQFMFKLERLAASADEYSGDAILATIGIHYQLDTLGSREVSEK